MIVYRCFCCGSAEKTTPIRVEGLYDKRRLGKSRRFFRLCGPCFRSVRARLKKAEIIGKYSKV
jgi:hypothetical protein